MVGGDGSPWEGRWALRVSKAALLGRKVCPQPWHCVLQSDLNLLSELGSAAGGCLVEYEGVSVALTGQRRRASSCTRSHSLLPCWEASEVSLSPYCFPKPLFYTLVLKQQNSSPSQLHNSSLNPHLGVGESLIAQIQQKGGTSSGWLTPWHWWANKRKKRIDLPPCITVRPFPQPQTM